MRRLAAAALLLASLTAACASGEPVTGDRRNVGVVTVVFTARPARLRVGQPVRLQLRLVNNSGQAKTVDFERKQFFDFWVTRGTREVWRWSDGRDFDASRSTLTLGSQEPQSFAESWTPESSGAYRVHGAVTTEEFARPLDGDVVVE